MNPKNEETALGDDGSIKNEHLKISKSEIAENFQQKGPSQQGPESGSINVCNCGKLSFRNLRFWDLKITMSNKKPVKKDNLIKARRRRTK